VYPSMAQAQVSLGRVAEATETMRKAHREQPDDLTIVRFWELCCIARGRMRSRRSCWRRRWRRVRRIGRCGCRWG